ncbi:MAG: hypothetical protein SFY67_17835 [Candidatus Melainabacteria bacterium]|nr:hypothetical protein [Candidatus Melainabacteria bacterium]
MTYNKEKLHLACSGPYAVNTVSQVLQDKKRDKELEIAISYPDSNEKNLPWILFSHGAYGSKEGYRPLVKHWVSHGFVCIQPTHEDSLRYFIKERRLALSGGANESNSQFGKSLDKLEDDYARWQDISFKKWRVRPLDMKFVLDSIDQILAEAPEVSIDKSNLGIGGHSFGAHTAQLLGGSIVGDVNIGYTREFRDNRAKAFLLMSPQGRGARFEDVAIFDDEAWSEFERPMMCLTGTNDIVSDTQDWVWRKDAFNLSKSTESKSKYLAIINGGYHGFGGIVGKRFTGAGPDNEVHADYTKALSLAFWNAFLKNDIESKVYLDQCEIEQDTHGEVEFSAK